MRRSTLTTEAFPALHSVMSLSLLQEIPRAALRNPAQLRYPGPWASNFLVRCMDSAHDLITIGERVSSLVFTLCVGVLGAITRLSGNSRILARISPRE